jgi:citrate lyase subunit beta/citryl-CoA lyase
MTARSYLYVPAHRAEMLAKSASRGADALILDLEDAVPADAKDDALAAATAFLKDRPRGVEVWVRVNAGALLDRDIRAIAALRPDGVTLPKVSSADDVIRLDVLLGESDIAVVPLIETASGVLDAAPIAAAPRVARLAIGEADLAAELGIDLSDDHRELAPMRAQIVLASAAARIDPPIGPVSAEFANLGAFRLSTNAIRKQGFGGRAAIHPSQVSVINEVFTPSGDAIAAARDVLARFDEAGGGATVDANGRMIDEAVVRAARRVLSLGGE